MQVFFFSVAVQLSAEDLSTSAQLQSLLFKKKRGRSSVSFRSPVWFRWDESRAAVRLCEDRGVWRGGLKGD